MTRKTHMRILIVDDDFAFRVGTLALLEDHGYDAAVATSGEEACRMLAEREYQLVVSDLVMQGMNGIALLQHIRTNYPAVAVIMVTGFASISTAIEAMRLGAHDYVTKPCDNDELILKIEKALEALRKDQELKSLRDEVHGVYSFGNMVGQNGKMREVYRLVEQVAGTDVPVLILGETGTGKELIARAIHNLSGRKSRAMIKVNCAALPAALIEAELFGHEKGAYTGATSSQIGRFEAANGSTIFLDEIGEL
ncbi:MAG TPA: sigma-54 dependent transcriptional regulator, partial [Bacteroidota bacterium]